MNSKDLLSDVHYKPFVERSPSNYWRKRAVIMLLHLFVAVYFVLLHCSSLTSNLISIYYLVCEQGGQIALKEVNNHQIENLIPSPNKNDNILNHIKGPGLHSYVEQPNSVKKYDCSPEATCTSHQCHFMKNTTTALYKHFLQMYQLRRGKSCSPQ